MKHFITYSVALMLMLLMGTNSYAKSWRVNSYTSRGAKFADINAAMSSAEVQNGDTLYLDPECTLSGQQIVNKQVTIMGNGFYHHINLPYGIATLSGGIVMKAANSKIEGVCIQSGCVISANNVTVERCRLDGSGISSNGNNCKNATIRNCYIITFSSYSIVGQGPASLNTEHWTIDNNIILFIRDYNDYNCIRSLNSANITNNYIGHTGSGSYCVYDMTNCSFINNIILNNYYNKIIGNCIDCVVHNNILSCDGGQHPNNICLSSNNENAIFTMTGNEDMRYQLCEDSPAIGYATDGGDCGPYGGGYTYVPGGMPYGIPYYTETNIATMDNNGKLKVSLKIAVSNE